MLRSHLHHCHHQLICITQTHRHGVETPCPLPSTQSISSSNQPVPELPSYSDMDVPCFNWGALDVATFSHAITSAYAEAIHWRRNLFSVPSGKAGTSFVTALASLYKGYGEGSAMESVALRAAMVMPILMLQKPHARSKSWEHMKCLERSLIDWKEGNIDTLLHEGHTIQADSEPPHLPATVTSNILHNSLLNS